VLDICSGLGGKSIHLGQQMNNQGRILAVDIYSWKLGILKKQAKNLGVENIWTICADGLNLKNILKIKADKILLDAPCSGLGVLHRRSDARFKKTEEQIKKLSELQKNLLLSASHCLKKNGLLLYSTCSIEPEENEEVIKWFLKNNTNFKLEVIPPELLGNLNRNDFIAPEGYFRSLPHITSRDGFFAAVLRKIG